MIARRRALRRGGWHENYHLRAAEAGRQAVVSLWPRARSQSVVACGEVDEVARVGQYLLY